MRDPSRAFLEPLLSETVHRTARCGTRALTLLLFIGSAILLHAAICAPKPHLTILETAIALANLLQRQRSPIMPNIGTNSALQQSIGWQRWRSTQLSPASATPHDDSGELAEARSTSQIRKGKGSSKLDREATSKISNDEVPAVVGVAAAKALPAVPRETVLETCRTTSLGMAAVAVTLREATHQATVAGAWNYGDWTKTLPVLGCFDASHVGVAVAAAGVVTAARVYLLGVWDDFAEATNRSNSQVLTPLDGPVDLLQVSVLPAVGEELLFRGALLPALGGGWAGVAGSGAVFGALHVSGGRNSAFAAWAGAVGVLYGVAGVATGDVLVPVAAHAIANFASASLWKQKAAS